MEKAVDAIQNHFCRLEERNFELVVDGVDDLGDLSCRACVLKARDRCNEIGRGIGIYEIRHKHFFLPVRDVVLAELVDVGVRRLLRLVRDLPRAMSVKVFIRYSMIQ